MKKTLLTVAVLAGISIFFMGCPGSTGGSGNSATSDPTTSETTTDDDTTDDETTDDETTDDDTTDDDTTDDDTSDSTTVKASWSGSITGGDWWTVFAGDDIQVESGTTLYTEMTMTANGGTNYTLAPDVILRKSDGKTEYAVVRLDNYGWGDNYSTATLTSDWNWDTIISDLTDATVKISVTNNGDDTATIRYDVTTTSGTTHYQQYANMTVDSDDLYINLTFENCSATFN
ncbi:MAG: hypothetical protein K5829_01835 [Treponema sp.]|nr:hypothetical protein [Treponema sp.]